MFDSLLRLQYFDLQHLPIQPWKNGGGVTCELVCQPDAAGHDDFDWRISVATIDTDGSFSRFPGVDRSITLLAGDGVVLHQPAGQHCLNTPLQPHIFAGEDDVECQLLGRASRDFNVMVRRSRARAEVGVELTASAPQNLPEMRHGLLMAVAGRWRLKTESPDQAEQSITDERIVEPGQGFWWSDSPLRWQVQTHSAEAALLWVRIDRLHEAREEV